MKKVLLVSLVMLLAAGAFAQDVNVYGKFRLDYDLSKSDLEATPAADLGGFNIDRARLGLKWELSEEVKAKLELDVYNPALRIAEFAWKAAEGVTVSGGRMYEVYSPNSEWNGSRFDGAGVGVDFGIGEFVLQLGDDQKTTTYVKTSDAGVDEDKVITDDVKQALLIMPAIILTPEVEGVELELGINGKIQTPYSGNDKVAADANFYALAEVADLGIALSADFNDLATEGTDLNINLNADISYAIDAVTVGVYTWNENLTAANSSELDANLELYAKVKVADGLKLIPKFALKHLTADEIDYKVTLRFEWNPSYDF